MRQLLKAFAIAGLLGGPVAAQDLEPPTAGAYTLDLSHGRVIFRVSHLGFSNYTALFTRFDADLAFDPDAPETMNVTAEIDVSSLETHYPDPALDFNALLTGPEFLDAAKYPKISFASTSVKLTGEKTAEVTGDLTMHGVTKPVTLAVSYGGGYGSHPLDPGGSRIGFSATGSLKRSEFGMGFGVPAPGTTLGVGDEVQILIETEFLKPAG